MTVEVNKVMQSILISVVVPIYNVEKYLNRCIESLVCQTYNNLEIMLVDDGALDECSRICDDWMQRDSRIKVIHKQNGGLSGARNAGLSIATGDYIGFVDSDDYVSEDFFESLLNTALKHNSEIVECNVARFYESGVYEKTEDDLLVTDYSTVDALSGLIRENPFHQHVWNKLYKSDVLKGIDFEVAKLNEDEFWTYQVFGRAKQVSKINKTMYFYFQRNNSIMGGDYSLRRLDGLEGRWQRHLYIEKNYPSLTLQSKLNFVGSCIFSYQNVLKHLKNSEKKEGLSIIRYYTKLCKLSLEEIKSVDGSARKYFYLARINLDLCCRIRNFFGIGF